MNFLKRSAALFFALVIISNFGFSQTYDFLRLDNSPRAAAMAGSFVANFDDPNVMFYNPSGINSLEGTPVSFSYLNHLLDINSASLAIAKNFDGLGNFAAGVQYITYGTFKGRDEAGRDIGNFSANDFAFTLSYGNKLEENFFYGVSSKIIYSGINDVSSTAIGFDIGLQYVLAQQDLSFGFSALNLGTQIDAYENYKEELPLDVRVGFSKGLQRVPVKFYFSFNRLNDDADKFMNRFNNFTFGGEIKLSNVLKLRLGYDNDKRKDLVIGTTAGLAGFNIGIGALINKYNFDYSFSSMGLIGSLHRIGISTVL